MIITTTHRNIINIIIYVMMNLLKYMRPARWQINNELTNTPWHAHANKTTIMTTRVIPLVIINESMETWSRRGVEVRAIFVEKIKIYHNIIIVVIRLTRTRTYHYSAWNENDRGSMTRLFWWNWTSWCILINYYPIRTHFSTIYYDLLKYVASYNK